MASLTTILIIKWVWFGLKLLAAFSLVVSVYLAIPLIVVLLFGEWRH